MKRLAVLMFAGVILLVYGCAPTAKWVKSPVVEQEYCSVDLEHREDQGIIVAQQFNHPCLLDAVLLETVLNSFSYPKIRMGLFGKPHQTPVFKDVEIDRLAPALADALAKANPDQRVSFISQNKEGTLFFSKRHQTQGVMFVKPEGYLNIAFGLINYELEPEEFSRMPSKIPIKDPLKIEKFEKPVTSQLPYATPHPTKSGNSSPVWLAVSLDELKKAPLTAPEQEADFTTAPVEGPGEKSGQAPQTKTWEDQKQQMEEKLRFLKGLIDEGLINQEEYEAQKSGILKELMEP